MAGRFSRRTIAAIAHSVVDHPSAGNTPSAPPSARLNAIFCGVTPCLSRATIGRSSLRLKNPSCTNRLSHLRIRVRRNHGTRVVVNDLPSVREALPNQGKHSSEVIVLPLQMPASQDERCLRPQKPELQFRKIQLSHRAPVGIVLLVSCQHAIPAARYAAAPGKRQLRRTPISHQKRVYRRGSTRFAVRSELRQWLPGRPCAPRQVWPATVFARGGKYPLPQPIPSMPS